jgi:hypothetical protein
MIDSNWMPVLLPLSKEVPGVKWILPQAPLIPSTYNNGQSLSVSTIDPYFRYLESKELISRNPISSMVRYPDLKLPVPTR